MNGLPTGVRGRLLALAILALAIVVLWVGVASPLIDAYDERAERLARQQALARRMAAIEATVPTLLKQAQSAGSAAPARAETLLEGATDAVAAASLQELIETRAAAAGTRIASTETLPAEPADAYRAIGLRVSLTAPFAALVKLLQAIADSDTPMLVDNVQFRGPAGVTRDPALSIDATFTITAYRAVPTAGTQPEAQP